MLLAFVCKARRRTRRSAFLRASTGFALLGAVSEFVDLGTVEIVGWGVLRVHKLTKGNILRHARNKDEVALHDLQAKCSFASL